MDVSQVQGSKCRSDFSIERILSEDSKVNETSPEGPSWLWCTRYQPPRIPRAGGSSGCRARRAGRHARVPFTAAQAAALEAAYARAPYLAPPALRALAAALQLRDDRIKIWFQNRRARERREKCASITPPQAMTLPATTIIPSSSCAFQHFTDSSLAGSPQDLSNRSRLNLASEDISTDCESPLGKYLKSTLNSDDDALKFERPDTPLDIETVDDDIK